MTKPIDQSLRWNQLTRAHQIKYLATTEEEAWEVERRVARVMDRVVDRVRRTVKDQG